MHFVFFQNIIISQRRFLSIVDNTYNINPYLSTHGISAFPNCLPSTVKVSCKKRKRLRICKNMSSYLKKAASCGHAIRLPYNVHRGN